MLEACGSSDGGVTSNPVQILDCSQLDLTDHPEALVEQFAATQVEAKLNNEWQAEHKEVQAAVDQQQEEASSAATQE